MLCSQTKSVKKVVGDHDVNWAIEENIFISEQ